jgi:hypothetical protein
MGEHSTSSLEWALLPSIMLTQWGNHFRPSNQLLKIAIPFSWFIGFYNNLLRDFISAFKLRLVASSPVNPRISELIFWYCWRINRTGKKQTNKSTHDFCIIRKKVTSFRLRSHLNVFQSENQTVNGLLNQLTVLRCHNGCMCPSEEKGRFIIVS